MGKLTDELIRLYVDAQDLVAIVVDPNGRSVFVPKRFDWTVTYTAVWWHDSRPRLEALAAGVPAGLTPDDYERLVLVSAERQRLRLTDHRTVIDRARGAVLRVENRLADMKDRGEMRALNVEYQDARLSHKERGLKFPAFPRWLHERKKAMVIAVAARAGAPTPPPSPGRLDDLPGISRRSRGSLRIQKSVHETVGFRSVGTARDK